MCSSDLHNVFSLGTEQGEQTEQDDIKSSFVPTSEQTRGEEEALQMGKPIQFQKADKHSFAQWLEVTRYKPIDRRVHATASVDLPFVDKNIFEEGDTRTKKFDLIDKFLESNPKIEVNKDYDTPNAVEIVEKKNIGRQDFPQHRWFAAVHMDAARLARIFWISMSTEVTQNSALEDSFAALFEESLKRQEMRQGEVITAEVIRVDHNYVVVNAGLKSESYVPVEEFYNDRGELEVQEGDFVSVAIDSLEDGFGETRLSRDRAKRLAAWVQLELALESGDLVTGTVTGKVKGGLTVMTNGIRAFLPGSLIDTRPVKDTTPYEGKTLEFKVIKLDRRRNNVVLSRRAVIELSQGEERAKLLETLTEGAVIQGATQIGRASCRERV